MKYFIPELKLAIQLSNQEFYQEKLGGLPYGLPIEKWPICGECNIPLALLAEFVHHDERLNLGREGRVIFVFQCNNNRICETWNNQTGANSCFILEPEELTQGITPCPSKETELE